MARQHASGPAVARAATCIAIHLKVTRYLSARQRFVQHRPSKPPGGRRAVNAEAAATDQLEVEDEDDAHGEVCMFRPWSW